MMQVTVMHLLSQKRIILILKICGLLAMLALLAACSDAGSTNAITPTLQSGTVIANTPGAGPTVIAVATAVVVATDSDTPTSVAKQVIALRDRTLTISQVGQQAASSASTTAISLTITVTNTGPSPILNQATFYQLVGAEGDAFGTQSSVSVNFYGSILPRGSRQGTIVFQVPTGAVKGLRLLYRPEVATETALIPLGL
jgi:hypothetical protein